MKKRTTPPTGRRHSGFTLIEMLIVVAIIAILVAVSIPLINNSLENARIATDTANERAAKAEILLHFLTDDAANFKTNTPYPYNAVDGSLVIGASGAAGNAPTPGYGKCTKAGGSGAYVAHNTTNYVIWVQVDDNGNVTGGWGTASADLKQGHLLTLPSGGGTAGPAAGG